MSKKWKKAKSTTTLRFESLEDRSVPAVLGGFTLIPGAPGTAFFDVYTTNNNPHRIDVFSDNQNGSTGIHIVGLETNAAMTTIAPGTDPFDQFISDQQVLALQIGGYTFQGVRVNPAIVGTPAFLPSGFTLQSGGNDLINAGQGTTPAVPGPGAAVTYTHDGLNQTNQGHRLAEANGLGGNDTIIGGVQNDVLNGGNGNDVVFGNSGPDTITGGDGNDTLTGGAGKDSMYGGTGWDVVCADGADFAGGVGENEISGGSGGPGGSPADQLPATIPSPNPNNIDRYSFSDFLVIDSDANTNVGTYNNATFEVIQGGDGNETIVSNNAGTNVEIYGNNGNDNISSTSSGNDSLYGGAGNDTLSGGAGADVLEGDGVSGYTTNGPTSYTVPNSTAPVATYSVLGSRPGAKDAPGEGSGNDCLLGGTGNDTLQGGGGNDTLRGGAGSDTLNDSGGIDTLDYNDAAATQGIYVVLGNNSGQPTVSVDGFGAIDTAAASVFENVIGSSQSDFIQGNNGANVLMALGGDDTVFGSGGADSMFGGTGNDYMYGDGGDDCMDGGAGNDALEGGDGNDLMRGASGDDVLEGQRGTDTINGGTGRDTVDGGLGMDTFVLDFGNPAVAGTPNLNIAASLNEDLTTNANGQFITTTDASGNDPLNGLNNGDEYWGGQERDQFNVYGAWNAQVINPATGQIRLFTNNFQVNDIIAKLFDAQTAASPRTDYFSGVDRLRFNPDFGNSASSTIANNPNTPAVNVAFPNGYEEVGRGPKTTGLLFICPAS